MDKIIILYAELMPYNTPVIRCLVQSGFEVHVVKWDVKRLTPYIPIALENVVYYNRSELSGKMLENLIEKLAPKVVFTCGWMDKEYCHASLFARQKFKISVIASSDTHWKGGKQWLNIFFSRFRHLKWFDYILVPGNLQFEYARRLGFRKDKILFPSLSADNETFLSVDIEKKKISYPRQLLYVGRLSPEKGISDLLRAWKIIEDYKGWKLKIIGSGPLKEVLQEEIDGLQNVSLRDFADQDALTIEMQESGCFIVPSINEPWGLVIHEAAAAGLPILASRNSGAASTFVIQNYNGFIFSPGDAKDIRQAILKIFEADTDVLLSMSYKSRMLSGRIKPEYVAAAILSVRSVK